MQFSHCDESVAIVNLGGVGNISWRDRDGRLFAFDTGPANAPINDWIARHGLGEMDVGGRIAATGTVDEDRLATLLQHPYFGAPFPKSLDRFDFPAHLADGSAVEDGAALLTSTATDRLIDPDSIEAAEVAGLIQRQELAVGDLVYLPRGVVHRGLGGVLTQVITAPGFIPGAEVGVDHHLRAVNERLGLDGRRALPFNSKASAAAVVK